MDKDRMIAAARRKARRQARKTNITYQQALDAVARELGRKHWSAFMDDPVEVPRDETHDKRHDDVDPGISPMKTTLSVMPDNYIDFKERWNMPTAERPEGFRPLPFMPGFNILANRFTGEKIDRKQREKHITLVTQALGNNNKNDYFESRGQQVLEGFIMVEIEQAKREKREPNIPSIIDMINQGIKDASALRSEKYNDAMVIWIKTIFDQMLDHDMKAYAISRLEFLISMPPNERSGVLGTMDRGLLPFKNMQIRQLNS